mgnify:CR=1 FL=1|jgi:hypothetical protein
MDLMLMELKKALLTIELLEDQINLKLLEGFGAHIEIQKN